MNTKIKKQLFLAMTALVFTACSENILDEQTFSSSKGRSANVQLNVSTASEQGEAPDTRAIQPKSVNEGTDANYTVSDFWLLEYGADGNLMKVDGSPMVQYITMTELKSNKNKLNIQLPSEGSSDIYKCVMIANTHDKDFFKKDETTPYNTLAKLKEFTKDITSFEDTYNSTGGTNDLYLSCVAEVNSTSTSLNCKFYRNVAKLTLQLNNAENSGMQLTSVQICNVPNKMAYADRLYDGNTAQMASGATTTDMPEDPIQMAEGTNLSFIYYLPRNCQGKDESITDVKYKNTSNAAASATCVKVYATEIKTDNPYCYTFYLGENMTTDFNVLSNYHYTLPITISAPGDAKTDPRVENLGSVDFEANCIMMSLNKNDWNNVYTIYPYKRINKFWHEVVKDDTKMIDENYDWEAVIVWQDTNDDVIEFVGSGKETFIGKGKRPLKIRLKNPTSTSPCNVLIGVRKKGVTDTDKDGYLWSWHLWITPYKPDRRKPWEDGKYEYTEDVTSGSVFRYMPGHSSLFNLSLWTYGAYKDKYIMDRNLGATTKDIPTPSEDLKKTGGLFYQHGRKDPFVAEGVTLYKQLYNGNSRSTVKIRGAYAPSYADAVKWPDWFYATNGTASKDWIYPNAYRYNTIWNNPFLSEKKFKNKSFFDPCPEGWRVPIIGTWNVCGGRSNVSSPNANGGFDKGWNFNVGNGVSTYYPATGFYDDNGDFVSRNSVGSCWSSTPSTPDGEFACYFSYNNAIVNLLCTDNNRANGFPVRCVQE